MCENFPSTKPVSFCCSPAGGNGDGFSSFVWADPKYNRCLVCIIVRHFCAGLRCLFYGAGSPQTGNVLRCFCSLMDDMLSGNMQPKQTVEEESLFYKIEYRLNRLYEVMQENKNGIAQERADLQELISDISHQVKTPIANLKMINSTLLENEVPVQKQKSF